MEVNPEIEAKGVRWLFLGGFIAVVVSFALYNVDEMLAHSKYDQNLLGTLTELRSAQASLPSNVTDARQLKTASAPGIRPIVQNNTTQDITNDSVQGLAVPSEE